ncbi:MAG: hypothetical protein BroJett038_21150 [Chloroflexota bacterium]|nr:MAG: hypothetical protein BroJett038_21150 [Chloroflexota bacterium]
MTGTRLFFFACLLVGAALLAVLSIPALQDHAPPSEAAAGMAVWRAYGCEGCHTLFGQGGSYAPDLTGIYAQRGVDYLREFLVYPAAFHPGQRLMPAFGLTVNEANHLLAFLEWVSQQQTGWPPRTIQVAGGLEVGVIAPAAFDAAVPDTPVARGEYWFKRPPAICATCHALEPDIIIVGPSLAGIATRAASRIPGLNAEAYLRQSIITPGEYIVPGFQDVMQKNLGEKLSAEQINDIISFLMTLQ